MRAFLATVLSIIAAGVLLVAYGLLAPRAVAAPGDVLSLDRQPFPAARPYYASERLSLPDDPYGRAPYVAAAPLARPAAIRQDVPAPRRAAVARASTRDWKKTALVIGGSTAAGAGLGGIVGGGKGAAIGAAIGGGASTLWEALHK